MEIGGCDSCGNLGISVGPAGPAGAAGTPGSVWRDGAGAPSNGLGVNGDYYLNDTNGDVYLKASGTYSIVANIKGPTGATGAAGANGSNGTNGSVWRDGAGAPSNSLGVNGDYYLNDTNGDVYLKAAGVYTIVANILGPTGATGAAGSSNVYVGTTVFVDSIYGVDATGAVENRQKPFLTIAAARAAALAYWNGIGHAAPSATNRILIDVKGTFLEQIVLSNYIDWNLNDSIIDLQAGALYTIDDNNVACDSIIYGNARILRSTAGTLGCIRTQNASTILRANFDKIIASRTASAVLCTEGTQIIKVTNEISNSGSSSPYGVRCTAGNLTIYANVSSTNGVGSYTDGSGATLLVYGNVSSDGDFGAYDSGSTSHIVYGNVSSSANYGAYENGNSLEIYGNISSSDREALSCNSGILKAKGRIVTTATNKDACIQVAGSLILDGCILIATGTGKSIADGSTVIINTPCGGNKALGTAITKGCSLTISSDIV